MTPLERAEKIQRHCLAHGGICSGPEVLAIIAAQIEEACAEIQHKCDSSHASNEEEFHNGYGEGFSAARQEFMQDCKDTPKDHVHANCPVIEKNNETIWNAARSSALEEAAKVVEGFTAAREQAVGIAHDYTALRDSSIEIERRLREMKP